MTVTEFFQKNKQELEDLSGVSECCEKAVELAKEQNVPEIIQLNDDYLLSAKLAAFFGWCEATEESISIAIDLMGKALKERPIFYCVRPTEDDISDYIRFSKVGSSDVMKCMPYAVHMDLCRHFLKELQVKEMINNINSICKEEN